MNINIYINFIYIYTFYITLFISKFNATSKIIDLQNFIFIYLSFLKEYTVNCAKNCCCHC